MFLVGITAFFLIRLMHSYIPLYVVVPLFWFDFLLKTVIGPQWSIFGFFGRFLTRGQKPEWVGAVQKRFAWGIGLVFSSVMIILALFMGVRGWIPLSICMICLSFMWLESAVGICVGCRIYRFLLDRKLIPEPAVRPACPGGSCSLQSHC